eukprot:IDg2817t1
MVRRERKSEPSSSSAQWPVHAVVKPNCLPQPLVTIEGSGPWSFPACPLGGNPLPHYLLDRRCAVSAFVVIYYIGARNSSPGLMKFYRKDLPKLTKNGSCLVMAIVYDVEAVSGSGAASDLQCVLQRLEEPLKSLSPIGSILRQVPAMCGVQRISRQDFITIREERKFKTRYLPFKWIVFAIREDHPIHLSVDSLMMCGGADADELRVHDARKVVP